MNLIITDNPNLHDKNNPDSLLLYQVFDWRINVKQFDFDNLEDLNIEDEFELKKRFKKSLYRKKIELNSIIIAIVAPSNYKLLYDLIYIKNKYNKKIVFYTWDSWLKHKESKINEAYIKKLFNEYIQRGYLTKLIYTELEYFNLQRVEQFLILTAISIGSKYIKTNKDGYLEHDFFTEELNINSIMKKILLKNQSVHKTVDKLIYHSRKNDINDPFFRKILFINDNKNSLKKYYSSIDNSLIKISDNNYLNENPVNIFSITLMLSGILTLTDILKTIRFLEKNDLIKSDGENGILTLKEFYDFNFLEYKDYINFEKWNSLYHTKTYSYGDFFPPIRIQSLTYKCPFCGSSEFKVSPKHFYCTDITCKLYVNRLINPGGVVKQVSELEFIRLINHGSTIIKNKIGGYNRFMLLKTDNICKIIPQIEKKIDEDN